MSYKDALGYESFTIPIATVLAYAGQNVPAGFLKCDGASYSIADYPDLFSEIENGYGGAAPNFNVPNLVTNHYIQGATLATAGDVNTGGMTATTDIDIEDQNLPSLSQANFSVTQFNIFPTILPYFQFGAVSGDNVSAGADSNEMFKTETNTTTAATFSLSGNIAVDNPQFEPLIAGTDPIPADVVVASYQMIYIIKAKYAPEPSFPPASPFAYIPEYYLRNTNDPSLNFNPQISGFVFPSNLTPL
jgi:microcystin-dependent protein